MLEVGGVDGRGRGGGWNRLSTPEAGAALRGAHTRCWASSAFDMQRRVSVQQIQQKGLRRKRPSGSRAGASSAPLSARLCGIFVATVSPAASGSLPLTAQPHRRDVRSAHALLPSCQSSCLAPPLPQTTRSKLCTRSRRSQTSRALFSLLSHVLLKETSYFSLNPKPHQDERTAL